MEQSQKINSTLSKLGTVIYNNNLNKNIKDPFQKPGFLIFLVLICIGFITYAIYTYMSKYSDINVGYTFYGKDLATFTPLFEIKTENVDKCVDRCKKDPLCQGITYQTDTKKCIGTEKGKLRNEDENHTAWIKKHSTLKDLLVKDNIILGYTNKQTSVSSTELSYPINPGNFCFGFTIRIDDFYEKFGKWRHIFHKGTRLYSPSNNGITINYQNWENITSQFPDQCIGVWLAPFTNNIRIAITTITQEGAPLSNEVHAYIQKCNDLTNECYMTQNHRDNQMSDGSVPRTRLVKNLEYVDGDLQNVPIGKDTNIFINVHGNNVELYINSKLSKIFELNGMPEFNREDLYIMNPITFKGSISNLVYLPSFASKKQINDISIQ